ncbi:alpha/beta fold hydrolase [Pseudothauera lacus]|uniref:Alpha/beta hydrolase n=1 Tax=Pseudothauera lacus TaxID=2136175 RepID=A0A2T4IH75_9RHOO|nr:alpha/beta fold hydrolase [Pseudothauera lacus]PTD97115.1 alpha/beta hydrolase [Pseudothauera lacus]
MVTLVLLPGLDGTGLLLRDFATACGPDIKVITASYPSDRTLDYAELESVARSFLPADEPFFLLAESFSGPIGISIAARPPPHMRGLILCCSFARNPQPMLAALRPFISILPVSLLPVGLIACFVLGRFKSPAGVDALASTLASVSPAVVRKRLGTVLAADMTDALARVRIPVLYLRAADDRVVPRASSELVMSHAPQTQVVELSAPHFLLQALPLQAAARVSGFIDEHTAG